MFLSFFCIDLSKYHLITNCILCLCPLNIEGRVKALALATLFLSPLVDKAYSIIHYRVQKKNW